jgi:hypothetical protein
MRYGASERTEKYRRDTLVFAVQRTVKDLSHLQMDDFHAAGPKPCRKSVGRILAIGHGLDRTVKFHNELRANVLRNLAWGEQLRSIGNERSWLTCWRLHYGPKVA